MTLTTAATNRGLSLVRLAVAKLPRGKARLAQLLSRVVPGTFIDTVEPSDLGIRMYVNPADPFQLEVWLGAYQPHVVSFLRKTIRPGDTVLVAGLHIGYTAAVAAKLSGPGGIILSAEPDSAAREVAQRNLAMLDGACSPIRVLAGGLSNVDGSLTLHLSSTLGHSSFAGPHQPRADEIVPLRRGDDWIREQGVSALDVMVLDVEGWECHAVEGLASVIGNSPNLAALIEVADWALRDAGRSVNELFEWLVAHGFRLRWAETTEGPYGVWGEEASAQTLRANDLLCIKGRLDPSPDDAIRS